MSLASPTNRAMAALGSVGKTWVRLWIRNPRTTRYSLELSSLRHGRYETEILHEADPATDGTASYHFPDDFFGAAPLTPGTRYRYELRAAGAETSARGQFDTAPADVDSGPDETSVAIMSCNQPFDENGEVRSAAVSMLTACRQAFEEHGVQRVLMLGDQMYGDYPSGWSLFEDHHFARVAPTGRSSIFDCTREEVRRLYQHRYREFFELPELQAIWERYPCTMILDDHDIVDNFGSDPAHSSSRWSNVREGALDAYYDYQGRRVFGTRNPRPERFDYALELGGIAGYILDLRSERRYVDGERRIYGEGQERDLARFLATHGDRDALLLGLSVPLVHLPEWLPKFAHRALPEGTDFDDRWATPGFDRQRDDLCRMIRKHSAEHPDQRLVIVAGDIHVGMASKICWTERGVPPTYVLISSAICNVESRFIQLGASVVSRMRSQVVDQRGTLHADVERLPGTEGRSQNPYASLNCGIVKVRRRPRRRAQLRLLLIGHDGGTPARPRTVFEQIVD